jgi:hypothetical protein
VGEVPPLPEDRPAQAFVHARADLLGDGDRQSTSAREERAMRKNAAEKFQGNPCYLGHSGLRYRCSGACVECMQAHGAAKRAKAKAEKNEPLA